MNAQLDIAHPEIIDMRGISYVMFVGPGENRDLKGAIIMPLGRVDRSSCGIGNSERMAAAARGLAKLGDRYTAHSIIGSTFEVIYAGDTLVDGRPAVRPIVSGRGWIHGLHQIGIEPLQLGFSVGDAWGDASQPSKLLKKSVASTTVSR